jgi:Tol biopolymer transport system component
MSTKLKRILLIAGLIIITALLAFALYYLFKKAGPLAYIPTEPVEPGIPGVLPPAGERVATTVPGIPGEIALPVAGYIPGVEPSYYRPEPVQLLTSEPANYVSLNNVGNMRYYNSYDGKFYRILPDGSIKEMSASTFYNVKNVTWAKNADKAVLEYPDNSKIIYNFDTQKQVTLPKHWEEFSFSPDSNQIAAKAIGLSPENRWLVTINDDGTGTKLVEAMGDNQDKVIIDWSPSRQTVAFSMTGEPLGFYRKEVLLVGLNGENFKSLVVEGMGFTSEWSPTGKKLLYSVYSDRSDLKPELWITNSYGQEIGSNRQSLEINTWPEKCAFANDNIVYCAVPSYLPQGAGISPQVASGIPDNLYKIDLTTGLKIPINTGGEYSIKNISFDETNNRLLFTEQYQSGVYEVQL